LLNLTATAASNFSQAVVNCYEFANETYMFMIVRFASQFDNDIFLLLNSFLFHVMGKALQVKDVFDEIEKSIANYNFYDVAF